MILDDKVEDLCFVAIDDCGVRQFPAPPLGERAVDPKRLPNGFNTLCDGSCVPDMSFKVHRRRTQLFLVPIQGSG